MYICIFCAFVPFHLTSSACPVLLDLIIPIIFGEEFKLWSSLCITLQPLLYYIIHRSKYSPCDLSQTSFGYVPCFSSLYFCFHPLNCHQQQPVPLQVPLDIPNTMIKGTEAEASPCFKVSRLFLTWEQIVILCINKHIHSAQTITRNVQITGGDSSVK